MPLLVLVVDEFAELSESMMKLDRLARLGRALGIQLVLATQRPSAQALGEKGTELRSQVDAVVAMRVGRPEEGNVVLGQGRLSEGWRPDRLKAKGEFLIASPEDDHDRPRRARAFRVTDKDIESWARECAGLRPHLDESSARAAEGLS
jgi:DNA segregation ATPase FtsK/SpoIIIE, S-DNA-T family